MNFKEKFKHRILYSHILRSEHGMNLTDYLSRRFPRFDAAGWNMQIRNGKVQVNSLPAAPETMLREHDCVAFFPDPAPEPEADLHFRTLYEDGDLLVFEKSGDLCVHPTGPFYRNTLWYQAGLKYGEIRFVNRLDRETSGLLVAARTQEAAAAMCATAMKKEYLALVFGDFAHPVRARGRLVHDDSSAVAKKKRFLAGDFSENDPCSADTELIPLRRFGKDMTLVRAIPHTGRQHQIRATLFSLGFPLAGDKLYGPDERIFLKIRSQTISDADRALLRLPAQALHSERLEFRHPFLNKQIRCVSPMPESWEKFKKQETIQ